MTAPVQAPPPAPVAAYPPRYWWLKRFALAGALFIVAVGGLRWWWGVEAERRLDAAIAEIVARGEPLYPEDFERPAVPDDDNAAILYEQAAKLVVQPKGGRTFGDFVCNRQTRGSLAEIRALINKNQRALDLVRDARSRSQAEWGLQVIDVGSGVKLSRFTTEIGQLGRLLVARATFYHETGDDRAAVASLNDALRLANCLDTKSPFLLLSLMRHIIVSDAANSAEQVVPQLSVTRLAEGRTQVPANAVRDDIQTLICAFVDEERVRRSWRRGMWAERAMQLDAIRSVLADASFTVGSDRTARARIHRTIAAMRILLLSPAFRLDAVRLLRHMSDLETLADQPNAPASRHVSVSGPEFDSLVEEHSHFMSMLLMPQFANTWSNMLYDWTQQALVGVALGMRLFEIDHGRRPDTLDELVPNYLPRVPIDLMADDGRQVTYIRGGENPRVYSVGMNACDDGGHFKEPTRATRRSGQPLPDDIIVYLEGRPGTAAASQPSDAQRIENDDDIERQPRNPH